MSSKENPFWGNRVSGRLKSLIIYCAMVMAFLWCSTDLSAQTATPTWSDLSGWSLNGSATLIGTDEIELTQEIEMEAASSWSPCKVDLLQDFDLEISVYLGNSDLASAGVAIVFQNDPRGATAIGLCCSSNGYGDHFGGFDPTQAVKPSVDVEIDTYGNDEDAAYGEPIYQHLGVLENGLLENGYAAGPVMLFPGNPDGQIADGLEHDVLIAWKAATNTLTVLMDTGAGVTYTRDIVANIFSGVSQVYWGVTGSTGAGTAIQYFKLKKGPCVQAASPTPTWTATYTHTPTPSFTPTATASYTSTYTKTPSATPTVTSTYSFTLTMTWTGTPTVTLTGTFTNTPTVTASYTPTWTLTPSATPTITPTRSFTQTMTWTGTPTVTLTGTFTNTPTVTPSATLAIQGPAGAFVYPNPVVGKVAHLAYQLDAPGFIHVRIYNSAYDLSAKFSEKNGPGNHVMELDLRGVAPGVYYVLVEYQLETGHRKLKPIHIYVSGRS